MYLVNAVLYTKGELFIYCNLSIIAKRITLKILENVCVKNAEPSGLK